MCEQTRLQTGAPRSQAERGLAVRLPRGIRMKGEIVVALPEDGRTPMVPSRCAILKPDREALLS